MSALPVLLLAGLAVAAFDAYVLRRPRILLGRGTAPVSDPRAARRAGLAMLLFGGALALVALLQFVPE